MRVVFVYVHSFHFRRNARRFEKIHRNKRIFLRFRTFFLNFRPVTEALYGSRQTYADKFRAVCKRTVAHGNNALAQRKRGKRMAARKSFRADGQRARAVLKRERSHIFAILERALADRRNAGGKHERRKPVAAGKYVVAKSQRLFLGSYALCGSYRFFPYHFGKRRAVFERRVSDFRYVRADRNFRKLLSAYKHVRADRRNRSGKFVLALFQHRVIQNLRRHIYLFFVQVFIVNNAVAAFVVIVVLFIYGYGGKYGVGAAEHRGNIHVRKSFADVQRFYVASAVSGNKRPVFERNVAAAVYGYFCNISRIAESRLSQIAHVFRKRKRFNLPAAVKRPVFDSEIGVALSAFKRQRRNTRTAFKRRFADILKSCRHRKRRDYFILIKRLVADTRYRIGQHNRGIRFSCGIIQ